MTRSDRSRRLALTLVALIAVATLATSGCVGTKAAYNNAGWFLMRTASEHFCPRDERRSRFEAAIDGLLKWHRTSELEFYAERLTIHAKALDKPVTSRTIDAFYNDLQTAWKRVSVRMAPLAVPLLKTMKPRERRCLKLRIAVRNRERMDEFDTSAEEYREERVEELISDVEDWVGDLSDDQQKQVSKLLAPELSVDMGLAKLRNSAFERFLSIVEAPAGQERDRALWTMFKDRFSLFPKSSVSSIRASEQRTRKLLTDVGGMLTAEQRAHLQGRLLEFAKDFRELAKE